MKRFKWKAVSSLIICFVMINTYILHGTAAVKVVDSLPVKGLWTTQYGVQNWAEVSMIQQFSYLDKGLAYAYLLDDKLNVTTPDKFFSVEAKYPLLGDVIADDDGNIYVVWGRYGVINAMETMFISKYSPDGVHIATTGFVGESPMGADGNTEWPFQAGSCSSAIGNGILKVYYARQMYNGHQSSNVIAVNISDMSPNNYDSPWNVPYVSHSFNQSVIWSGSINDFLYADHGDAGTTRGFTIGTDWKISRMFTFYLQANANYNMSIVNKTFAQMGGLVETSAGVAFVGASARSISAAAETENQNLFVQIFDPAEWRLIGGEERSGATSFDIYDNDNSPLTEVTDRGVIWLTDYFGKDAITPHVAAAGDNIVIIWKSYTKMFYMVLSASGDILLPPVSLGEIPLNSYEAPIYHNGSVYWAAADDGLLQIMCIENVNDVQNVKVPFSDPMFEAEVRKLIGKPEGDILISDVAEVTTLSLTGKNINDLNGIQYFTSLKELYCGGNNLTSLDLFYNKELTKLVCSNNRLTSLSVWGNKKLRTLDCRRNFMESEEAVTGVDKEVTIYYDYEPQDKPLHLVSRDFETEIRNIVGKPFGIELRMSDVEDITVLDVSDKAIDLRGLELLPALKILKCSNSVLYSLDISQNTALEELYCSKNYLSSLDISNNTALKTLICNDNLLTGLDISGCPSLKTLDCSYNYMDSEAAVNGLNKAVTTDYKFSPQRLQGQFMFVDRNFEEAVVEAVGKPLSSITKEDMAGITYLNLNDKNISDLSGIEYFTGLKELRCFRNSIRELDLSKLTNLEYLNCGYNKLTKLDVSKNTKLIELHCYLNELRELDVTKNTELTYITCYNNKLSTLDISKNKKLEMLSCANNYMESEAALIGLDKALTLIPDFERQYYFVTFADPALEAAVRQAINKPTGELNNEDVQWVNTIEVPNRNITDLTGIKYLKNLEFLDCSYNLITEIDVSGAARLNYLFCNNNPLTALNVDDCQVLGVIDCSNTLLTSLDVSKCPGLKGLNCRNNQFTEVDVSKNLLLEGIACSNNQIKELDVSKNKWLINVECEGTPMTRLYLPKGDQLRYIYCPNNQLTELDVSGNPNLEEINCNNNKLKKLDISVNKNLFVIDCLENQIDTLDTSNMVNLWYIRCSNNKITSLDLSKSMRLQYLFCENNQITDLVVPKTEYLIKLYCQNNKITELDLSANDLLIELDCSYNQLTKLDVPGKAQLPELNCQNNQLTELDVSGCSKLESLYCQNNKLTELDVSECERLMDIYCSNNELTRLYLLEDGFYSELDCSGNRFTELDIWYAYIETLICKNNLLTELYLPEVLSMFELDCSGNQLTELVFGQYFSADILRCNNNLLTSLDTSCLGFMSELDCSNNLFTSLDLSNSIWLTTLNCSNNRLTALDLSNNTELTTLDCSGNLFTSLDLSNNTELAGLYCSDNLFVSEDVINGLNVSALTEYVFNPQNVYTVTFADYDGAVLKSQNVIPGTGAVPPDEPFREKYTFIGWDKPFDNVTSNLTVTARYIVTYMMTANFDSGTWTLSADYCGTLALDPDENWIIAGLLGDSGTDQITWTRGDNYITVNEGTETLDCIVKLIKGREIKYVGVTRPLAVSGGKFDGTTWLLPEELTGDAVLSVLDMSIEAVLHDSNGYIDYDGTTITVKQGADGFNAIVKLKNKRTGQIQYIGISKE